SGVALAARRGGGRVRASAGNFWTGISAVGIKELRGRMRGRRAFAVVTIYLLLLSLFAFAIYHYLKQQSMATGFGPMPGPDWRGDEMGWAVGSTGTALSAGIGHAIFGGLLMVETLLVLILAPAFTAGAISLEREKQTLELLITTPLSTLGMVVGKLLSALTYVFLLIIASIPLASLVFVFGSVGPEDLLRGYVMLFALAFGMGAIGLFISALVKRTQTATVLTFVLVIVLSIGTFGLHSFWMVAARQQSSSGLIVTQRPGNAPESVLWLNPFVADLDLICSTAPDAYHVACIYMSAVTGKPYFGASGAGGVEAVPMPIDVQEVRGMRLPEPAIDCPPGVECRMVVDDPRPAGVAPTSNTTFGFPRDVFWPKSALAFFAVGMVLTLLSSQLVSPTRRLRFGLPIRRRPRALGAPPSETTSDANARPAADVAGAAETTMENEE
ncbi:MAG: ABC transporter permease subunit, partial [Chloroflexota bacterium]|nr:ABC transporter permease subunit [Chloroflexota bacterium]